MDKYILTKREKEVLTLLVNNKSTKEIAEILDLAESTVRRYLTELGLKYQNKGLDAEREMLITYLRGGLTIEEISNRMIRRF